MPQITAWECNHTHKLFKHKSTYRKHLRAMATERREQKRCAIMVEHAEQTFREFRLMATFEDIEQWIINNVERLYYAQVARGARRIDSYAQAQIKKHGLLVFKSVRLTNMKWDWNCSISHKAPIGMKTNWGGERPDYPRSMPGYRGRIEFLLSNDRRYPNPTDLLDGSGLCIGSGGGGAGSLSYDITLFAQDWGMLTANDIEWGDVARAGRGYSETVMLEGSVEA